MAVVVVVDDADVIVVVVHVAVDGLPNPRSCVFFDN